MIATMSYLPTSDPRLQRLTGEALDGLTKLEVPVAPLAQQPDVLAFEIAGADGRALSQGNVANGRTLTTLVFVVAALDRVQLTPAQRLQENATAALAWFTDRQGQWGLRDGMCGDPLDPVDLNARVQAARTLIGRRPLPADGPGDQDRIEELWRELDRVGVPNVVRLPDAIRFPTPGGTVEARTIDGAGGSGLVLWIEVGRSERDDLASLLLSRNAELGEGAFALTPDGMVVVRCWTAALRLTFDRLARLLAPALTSAIELRPLL
jgi:hypothetical protein